MYMQLVRESFTDNATEGKLFVNGTFECYTLEDKDRKLEEEGEKVYGKTAIPRGKYDISITFSNHFHKDLPLLADVPQFEGVRLHSGNSSKDTEGCILVGAVNHNDRDDFIGQSKAAFKPLMGKIEEALKNDEQVTIEIV